MTKQVFVTVDWDFFFHEDQSWDWGHRENSFFGDQMWSIRASGALLSGHDLEKEYVPDDSYRVFWSRLQELGFDFSRALMRYADSHLGAYMMARIANLGHYDMYNFDNHQDVAYNEGDVKDSSVHCGNWLGKVLDINTRIKATVVYPYRDCIQEDFEAVQTYSPGLISSGRLKAEILGSMQPVSRTVDIVYVARSGSWTPPWADSQFLEFVKMCPCSIKKPMGKPFSRVPDMGNTDVRKFDHEAVVAEYEAMKDQYDKLRQRQIYK